MQIPQVRKNLFLVSLAKSVAAAVERLGAGRVLLTLMSLHRIGG